ncbi:MAG: UDP-N-acetylmuramoyl-tripeptide--D-alanyl-D-alanine ligase [Lentisphaeria bacterium]|nr:UDP-N-acetylmuramoyl-tripeptide--D-alanyl-D-alanine ligase [Lentisphaeria bacterium]
MTLDTITGGEWILPPPPDFSPRRCVDDSRMIVPGDLFVAIKGELADGYAYIAAAAEKGAGIICADRGPSMADLTTLRDLNVGYLLVGDALEAFHAFAAFHRQTLPDLFLIAVTGSSGKTSIRSMIQAILEEAFPNQVIGTEGNTNNFFGVPRNVFRLRGCHRAAVLELGTNHPGEIARLAAMTRPDAAVVANVGKAHIEFFGTQEAIAREKGAVFEALPAAGLAVMPVDGPGTAVLRAKAGNRPVTTFGAAESGADVEYDYRLNAEGGSRVNLFWRRSGAKAGFDWPLSGRHQAANAAAAAAVCGALALPVETIVRGLRETALPGARMRVVEENGIMWRDDAYNSNPESARASLEWFHEAAAESAGRLFVVLGDMLELGADHAGEEHRQLLAFARKLLPEAEIIAVGNNMAQVKKHVKGVRGFADADAAGTWLRPRLRPGDQVLLKGSRGIHLERVRQP